VSAGLEASIRDAHVLVTTGAGGVGKTTTAAALGVAAARAGRRTLVLTIDPARRLAQAMGLERLDDTPSRVPLPVTSGSGSGSDGQGAPGELHAMMLDMQTTFDRLVDAHATSADHARAIKSNRIYRTLSSTLSGTQEYMAMERLHELHEAGTWDLIVVDTPPTRSALDFLDAPKRMTSFLDGRLLRLLLKPSVAAGKGVGRMVGFGATTFMRVAGKVTGMDLLEDLADFFRNFEGMYDGSRSAPARCSTCSNSPRPASSSSPRRSRRRCARPASSSSGSSRRSARRRARGQPHPPRGAPRPLRRRGETATSDAQPDDDERRRPSRGRSRC
jgi:anion-transporting  ArsA/GET3 family ATPase